MSLGPAVDQLNITHSEFLSNRAGSTGGGVDAVIGGKEKNHIFANNLWKNNTAVHGPGGGAISTTAETDNNEDADLAKNVLMITNNTFIENR